MTRVVGIGGIFLRAKGPRLAAAYRQTMTNQ